MTMFLVKQMIGSKVDAIKEMMPDLSGGDDEDPGKALREQQEAIRQAENARRKKFKAQFEEREVERQEFRQKYGIKGKTPKPEWMLEAGEEPEPDEPEQEEVKPEEEEDEEISEMEKKLDEMTGKAKEKCLVQ